MRPRLSILYLHPQIWIAKYIQMLNVDENRICQLKLISTSESCAWKNMKNMKNIQIRPRLHHRTVMTNIDKGCHRHHEGHRCAPPEIEDPSTAPLQ